MHFLDAQPFGLAASRFPSKEKEPLIPWYIQSADPSMASPLILPSNVTVAGSPSLSVRAEKVSCPSLNPIFVTSNLRSPSTSFPLRPDPSFVTVRVGSCGPSPGLYDSFHEPTTSFSSAAP